MTALCIAAGLVSALVVFVIVVFVIDGTRKDVIAEGVRISTLDVGGMGREQTRALAQQKLAGKVAKRVAVSYRGQRFVLRPQVLDARLDADNIGQRVHLTRLRDVPVLAEATAQIAPGSAKREHACLTGSG